ncbi:hypothetical protein M404DRAFT_25903, partial [Pisolithus tinctorius Marx 270]
MNHAGDDSQPSDMAPSNPISFLDMLNSEDNPLTGLSYGASARNETTALIPANNFVSSTYRLLFGLPAANVPPVNYTWPTSSLPSGLDATSVWPVSSLNELQTAEASSCASNVPAGHLSGLVTTSAWPASSLNRLQNAEVRSSSIDMSTAGQFSGLGTALTWTSSSPNRLQSDERTINPVTSFVENVKSSANSSSWHARNPGVPVQPIKARAPRLLSTAEKSSRSLTKEDKAKRAKELHDALESFLHSQNAKLEAIAAANNFTFDHVKGLINTKTNYHHSHRAMLQNALVHAKSLEVNTDRPVGEKLPMARLQELVKVDLEAHPLSQSEEELLIEKLQEYCELKTCGTCMNNTVTACDVNYTVDRITKELENL